MTENVEFELLLDFYLDREQYIILRFEKSNPPSGLAENADYIDFQITVKPSSQTINVKIYFPNKNMGSTDDCSLVFTP